MIQSLTMQVTSGCNNEKQNKFKLFNLIHSQKCHPSHHKINHPFQQQSLNKTKDCVPQSTMKYNPLTQNFNTKQNISHIYKQRYHKWNHTKTLSTSKRMSTKETTSLNKKQMPQLAKQETSLFSQTASSQLKYHSIGSQKCHTPKKLTIKISLSVSLKFWLQSIFNWAFIW